MEWCDPWASDQIKAWQNEDPGTAKLLVWMASKKKPKSKDIQSESATVRVFWFMLEQLETIDGLFYRVPEPGNRFSVRQLVAQRAVRNEVFNFLHTKRTCGHLGINCTAASARKIFWWLGIKKDVIRWCRHCNTCQYHILMSGACRSSLHQTAIGAPSNV